MDHNANILVQGILQNHILSNRVPLISYCRVRAPVQISSKRIETGRPILNGIQIPRIESELIASMTAEVSDK
jgi:hypothetical protein